MGCALELVLEHYPALRSNGGLLLKAAYSRRGTQTALMSIIFTLQPGQQKQRRSESICSATEGFHARTESDPAFISAQSHASVPPHPGEASSCVGHTGSNAHSPPQNLLFTWGSQTLRYGRGEGAEQPHVPWALSQLQRKMQMGNCD